ncbi:MAG: alpha/beta hydrolase, partial [Geminicoccaceae bacterium]
IVGIGGYYNIVAAITYLTTGYFRPAPDASWLRGAPEADARWFFVLAGATHMPRRDDREQLTEIAKARLAGSGTDLAEPNARLGEDGRAMLALAENTDPDRVPQLLAALPAPVRADIERLDLKRYPLATLQADLLLIHGRDDPLVPATESRALAAAVAPGRAQVVVVANLSHVEIRPGGVTDSLRLWSAAYRLLTLREGLTVPAPDRCEVTGSVDRDPAHEPRPAMAPEQRVSLRSARRRVRRSRGAWPRP